MDFWIASYPRSGNRFLRTVLSHRYGIQSIDPNLPNAGKASANSPQDASKPHVAASSPTPESEPRLEVLGLKTHHPPTPGDTRPAVYLVRDGRGALVSYAHFALNFIYNCPPEQVTPERLLATLRDLILEKRTAYKTWSENVEAWLARENTLIIHFEELIAEPIRVADRIAGFLGLDLPVVAEDVPTFDELKAKQPLLFRKGRKNEWQEVFTPELHRLFWDHNGETMIRLGYAETTERRKAA
jgi:hypothetical protein